MITELRQNIYSIAKGSSIATDIFYLDSIPEAIYPFMVFYEVSNVDDRDTMSKYQKVYLQFSAFDIYSTPERVEAITNELYSLFEDKESSFNIPGYKVYNIKRMFTRTGRTSIGEFHFISQYVIDLEKL